MREDFVLGRRPRVGLRLHFGEDAPLLIEIERDINRKREREREREVTTSWRERQPWTKAKAP